MSVLMKTRRSLGMLVLFVPLCLSAHEAAEPEPVKLEQQTVTAEREGSLTAPSVDQARKTLQRTPGATAVVDSDEYKNSYALSVKDMLKTVPGVYAQQRINEESRVSIRGSGVSRGFHLRGLTLLQDGVPINLADGGGDFYELDPLVFRHVEVYKGGNGLRYGANSLGGAINFVTPTAHTTAQQYLLSTEGGSFSTKRQHAEASGVFGAADVFAAATVSAGTGYRDHSGSHSTRLSGNAGYQFTPDLETRFYLTYNNQDQLLPGTLTLAQAATTPQMATAAAISGNQARNTDSYRLVNKTAARFGDHTLETGAYFFNKRLFHPIFEVIDQDGDFYGVFSQVTGKYDLAGLRNVYTLGLRVDAGKNDARQFVNAGGNSGALRQDASQDASNLSIYGETEFHITREFALVTGGQFLHSDREVEVRFSATGNRSDSIAYDHFSPKIGILWDFGPKMQAYANINQSYEVPTFSELVQGGNASFVALAPQEAWTIELGTRGEQGRFDWDATGYRAHVRHEMLQYTTGSGVPAATFNAGDTIHQGVELGFGLRVASDLIGKGDAVKFRQAYTFSDFRFDGDAQYGNNRIAGVPSHYMTGEFRYTHPAGLFVSPSLEYSPLSTDVDFANTLQAPAFTVLNLSMGWEFANRFNIYLDGRNLTDRRYISTFSTIGTATSANSAVFYPGDGRAVYLGLKLQL